MKSNYPRSVEAPDVEAQPLVWPYSIGLGMVIVAIMAIESYWGRNSVFSSDSIPVEAAVLCSVLVIASGVGLIWKASRWLALAKAKLVAIASVGSWLVAVLATLIRLGSMAQSSNNALVLGVSLVTMVIILTIVCIPIWLLAALVRKFQKIRLERRNRAAQMNTNDASPLNTVPISVEPEAIQVRTNA
ncbi:MAG TPA: hypothetical protein VK171_05615 [Fimbriimonas sp.]|nr:hypothetical protein [Fimbriimonas sp.]